MRAKNRIKINRKSIPNLSKINQKSTQNWSKICQKSTPNRSKIAPWRGSRFFMIFGHILGPLLDPFWTHFRPKNNLENISEITCKNISKKVRRWTFQVLFLGSIFTPNVRYFPNSFQALNLSVRFTCFVHFSNRCTLKKHCISAVKHVFQQGLHIWNSIGKTQISQSFRGQFSTLLASIFDTFSASICSMIFETVLAAL